ncbi:murein biosynthesis integral membrane protein MurJ [Brevibacillus dissolubilis]|uniref:murein biosynthesis integral membrane protein MurJ n=1 Tax=Brevibacillus dissolubilis TaxID=1844116 RepID=UPI001116E81C|nr:murein biosynthesis integral membrane protein MurJ [Brevibacillus dissolubilis]
MSLVKTASMIVLLTLVGRLLGFIRNIYVSDLYGTNMEADVYMLALTIPATLFLVIPGAINAVLIPTMRGILEKKEEGQARLLYHKMLTLILVSFTVLTALGIWLSPQIASWYGLTGIKAEMTAHQLQLMWPSVLFIGMMGLWASLVNAHEHYFTPTLGTVANGAVVILAMYALVPLWGLDGISIGTSLGYLAGALVILPTLRKLGYRHRLALNWRQDEHMRSMGERVIPILIGAVISQSTVFLERGFTTALGDGKVAALGYANQIAQLPMAIFVGAFTLPLFPLLSSYVKRGEMDLMKDTLQKGLAYLLVLLVPVTVGLILYGEPLIRLLFAREGGAFDETSVAWTQWGLAFYSLGLYFLAARDLLTRAFYALENTRTPVTIGVVGIAIYIATAYLTAPVLDHGGVALSMSVSALAQSLLLFLLLWRKTGRLVKPSFVMTLTKVLIASAVMAGAILALNPWLSGLQPIFHLLIGVSVAVALYGVSLIVLREELAKEMIGKFTKRFARSKQ